MDFFKEKEKLENRDSFEWDSFMKKHNIRTCHDMDAEKEKEALELVEKQCKRIEELRVKYKIKVSNGVYYAD